MRREPKSVDVSGAPELERLAEEARRTGKPLALKRGHETIAVVRPVPKHVQRNGTHWQSQAAEAENNRNEREVLAAQRIKESLRAAREFPIDQEALFAPPSPELIARRKEILEHILAHAEQRRIAPPTAADLIHEARAWDEERRGFNR
jgi:hypothetical protein